MKAINLVETSPAWRSLDKHQIPKAPLFPVTIKKAVLTKREIEIIQLMFNDYNTFQIAKELSISTKTVETHRKNMLKKTGIHSPVGLIKYALLHGLIHLD